MGKFLFTHAHTHTARGNIANRIPFWKFETNLKEKTSRNLPKIKKNSPVTHKCVFDYWWASPKPISVFGFVPFAFCMENTRMKKNIGCAIIRKLTKFASLFSISHRIFFSSSNYNRNFFSLNPMNCFPFVYFFTPLNTCCTLLNTRDASIVCKAITTVICCSEESKEKMKRRKNVGSILFASFV